MENRPLRPIGTLCNNALARYQIAESVWNKRTKKPETRIIHKFVRVDDPKAVDRLRKLAKRQLRRSAAYASKPNSGITGCRRDPTDWQPERKRLVSRSPTAVLCCVERKANRGVPAVREITQIRPIALSH